jgi:hypothetical protein
MTNGNEPEPMVIDEENDLFPLDPTWLIVLTLLFQIGVVLLFIFYVRPF